MAQNTAACLAWLHSLVHCTLTQWGMLSGSLHEWQQHPDTVLLKAWNQLLKPN